VYKDLASVEQTLTERTLCINHKPIKQTFQEDTATGDVNKWSK